jgi:pilus assembly protein CpaF
MRPDRIVVGEVRGPEALPAMWAMSTGHRGSMMSIHARSAAHARGRFVDLALAADGAPAETTLRRWTDDVIDVVVHLERGSAGRAVAEILVAR